MWLPDEIPLTVWAEILPGISMLSYEVSMLLTSF